jgi:hypothetical protein
VFRQVGYRARKFRIKSGIPFETEFDLTVPARSMHSFVAVHNEVAWWLVVRGKVARWPVFERRFPVYVYPHSALAMLPTTATRAEPLGLSR